MKLGRQSEGLGLTSLCPLPLETRYLQGSLVRRIELVRLLCVVCSLANRSWLSQPELEATCKGVVLY